MEWLILGIVTIAGLLGLGGATTKLLKDKTRLETQLEQKERDRQHENAVRKQITADNADDDVRERMRTRYQRKDDHGQG